MSIDPESVRLLSALAGSFASGLVGRFVPVHQLGIKVAQAAREIRALTIRVARLERRAGIPSPSIPTPEQPR